MSDETAAEVTEESAPSTVVMLDDAPVVEPAVEAQPAEEVTESAPVVEAAQVEEPAPSESEKVQQRIDKITREKYEARRHAEGLQAQLDAQAATKAEPQGEPKLEDYDFDEDKHTDAVADYRADKRIRERDAQAAQNRALDASAKKQAAYNVLVEKFKEKAPDFVESVQAMPLENEHATEVILTFGPELAYRLSKNIALVDELNGLGPVETGIRLAAELQALKEQPTKKKTTGAPDPVTTLGGGGALTDSMKRYEVDGATFD